MRGDRGVLFFKIRITGMFGQSAGKKMERVAMKRGERLSEQDNESR